MSQPTLLPAGGRRRPGAAPVGVAAVVLALLVAVLVAAVTHHRSRPAAVSQPSRYGAAAGSDPAGRALRTLDTGRAYSRADLVGAVQSLLAHPRSSTAGAASSGCLAALATAPGQPALLVDRGSFAGAPVLVVAEPLSATTMGVYVLRPGCSAVSQQVLLYATGRT